MVLSSRGWKDAALRAYLMFPGISHRPRALNVFTTSRCNLSCPYCSRNVPEDARTFEHRYTLKTDFPPERLALLLERYPSFRHVAFIGTGEPFLNRDLVLMAEMAHVKGLTTSVITNGTLLHRYRGRIGQVFDSVSVSLHALSGREMRERCGADEALFAQVSANIDMLVTNEVKGNPGLELRSSLVLQKGKLERIREAAGFCSDHGLRILDLQNYLPVGLHDGHLCIYDDDAEVIAALEAARKEFAGSLAINLPPVIRREPSAVPYGCTSFFTTLRVDGLGNVSGCTGMMVPDAKNGNAFDEADVWENPYFTAMRERFRRKRDMPECCRYCPAAQ